MSFSFSTDTSLPRFLRDCSLHRKRLSRAPLAACLAPSSTFAQTEGSHA
jgi:hypothetical protein